MPTLIGTDTVSSISRSYIFDQIIDMIYPTNALFFRLNQSNKKMIDGGTHVEVPFMYTQFANGGPYQGYDLLDVSPNDTIKNGGWDIKQQYVPVTVDGLTLAKCNTTMAVVNLLTMLWEQAGMQLANNLGTGLYSDIVSNVKQIDGLKGAVDAGGVATSYAGLLRSANTFLNAQVDSSTTTLTLASLASLISSCTIGGHAPTIAVTRSDNYNRLGALLQANQRFIASPTATDQQLGNAGFTNLTYQNIPFVLDSKVFNGSGSNSSILLLNEEVLRLAIFSDTDFQMEDFQKPVNQDAMVGKLLWYGNLLNLNPQLCGKMTALTA